MKRSCSKILLPPPRGEQGQQIYGLYLANGRGTINIQLLSVRKRNTLFT